MASGAPIRPRVRDAILQSLRAGVVPRIGLEHVQVGRARETQALLKDVERIAGGGTSVRFVIGEYGAGKTFFLHLVRSIAHSKKLVTLHADLTPDRRLQATGGQARALWRELVKNASTRSKPDGGALEAVIERFATSVAQEARKRGVEAVEVLRGRLVSLSEEVGGYDFAAVVEAWWRAREGGDEARQAAAERWLRGEYATRTEARAALGVRSIVDDGNVYEHWKLLARLARLAGYRGLLVCLDEVVNLYKLANARARKANYERILAIVNDALQGQAEGLGVVFGGTPELLTDPRRGLYSYPALQSRLSENTWARDGLVDLSGPVIRLANLTREELWLLLKNVLAVQASGDPDKELLPEEGLKAFLAHCTETIGEAWFKTPRNTVKSFVGLLAVLEQNPNADWRELVGTVEIEPDAAPPTGGDDLATFRL